MIFLLKPVDVIDCINRFSNVQSASHIWDKCHLVLVYNYFYVLMGLFCSILLRIFASVFMSGIGLYFCLLKRCLVLEIG